MQFFGVTKLWQIATIRISGGEKFGGCLAVLAGNILAILVLFAKFANFFSPPKNYAIRYICIFCNCV